MSQITGNGSDLTKRERDLLNMLPIDGDTVSNPAAQQRLGWSDSKYWEVRDILVDKGLILRGRGRGGTVRRVVEDESSKTISIPVDSATNPVAVEAVIRRELSLYEPMKVVIEHALARDRRSSPLAVEITALQGRRSTGGTWSRPDIVSVEVKTYQYVPGKFLEVVSYEVKAEDSIDLQAVYEALAHRRSATRSYVIYHLPPTASSGAKEKLEDIRIVARSHGIGVISVGDASDYDTWEELEEAQRFDADPERLDRFISSQLSTVTQTRIARALR